MLRKTGKSQRTRRAEKAGASFLALDVGTEWAKAVIVSVDEPRVLGVGRARQHLGDMDGGAVAHIDGVSLTVGRALREAITLAGESPRYCIAGIAGELVQGVVTPVECQRRRPEIPLSMAEIERLAATALPIAREQAREKVAMQTGLESPYVELVDTALVDVMVDGYRVTNPLDFRGQHLHIGVFHTFSPLVHLRALETVVERAGCKLLGIVAEPFAVAACALPPEAYELGAIVIDIGGGSTDVAVVEKRGLAGTKMVAMGGRAFTRSLADAFAQNMDTAEELKLDYAAGTLEADYASKVRRVVNEDLQVLRDALRFSFTDLKGTGVLPSRIYLCGGGTELPGVLELLRDATWVRSGFFSRQPMVFQLDPCEITGIGDVQGFLHGTRDVTPKALAAQGSRIILGNRQIWNRPETSVARGV